MVSHRLRSISSVLGGKNSKEIAGDFSARSPSGAGVVTSVMAPQTPFRRYGRQVWLQCAKINQSGPSKQPIVRGNLPNYWINIVICTRNGRQWAKIERILSGPAIDITYCNI